MAQLCHPNVVTVHEVSDAEPIAFVVMELVEGMPLHRWLDEQPRPVSSIVAVLRAAAAGLSAVHALGVVHRDFKPANVLVGAAGQVKVADFGLAQPQSDEITQADGGPGAIAGTPRYMAPEQIEDGVADARSDQFSFCATLYEALTGERFQRSTRRWPRVSPRGGPVSRRIIAAVERGLAVDPSERWPSMDALARALRPRTSSLWGVIAAAGVATAAIVAALLSAPVPCERDVVQPRWDADTSAVVGRALRADGGEMSGARAQFITGRLETWVSSWRGAVGEVCEQAPADERLQRLRCLEVLTYDFDAIQQGAAALAHEGDGDVAASLPRRADIDACRSGDAERLAARMPSDVALATTVRELRRDLARVRHGALDPAERMQRYQALVGRAQAAGFAPVEREVFRALSRWHDASGSKAQALETSAHAYRASLRSLDPERAALDALDTALVASDLRRDDAVVQMWIDHARSHARALDDDTDIGLALLRTRGLVALRAQRIDDAIVELETAYDRAASIPGESARTTNALAGLVEAYSRNDQHALAIDAARLHVAMLEADPEVSTAELVGAHLNASATHGRAGHTAIAGAHLERGLALAQRRLSAHGYLRAMLEINLGAFHAQRDPKRAAEHYGRARAALTEQLPAGHPLLVRTDFEWARAMAAQADYEAAHAHMQRAAAVPSPVTAQLGIDAWLLELGTLRPGTS